jgi:RNA polymerase sigma-70 factor (sigma-E family)
MSLEFEVFVTARYQALVRYGTLLMADHGHGEDLVQAALVKTHTAWDRLRDGDPEAYTRRVMIRAAWRAHRRLWRREVPAALVPDSVLEDPTEASDTARLVLGELAKLPAQQRVVLVLKYWVELSDSQIAEQLGCATGTVKSRTSRGLASLRAGPLGAAVADLVAHESTG